MTDDEVDLIYDYLHQNYDYKDGNLIRKIKNKSQRSGKVLGCFSFTDTQRRPKLCTALSINGKKYKYKVAHLIYLFHYKKYPFCIHFKDNNSVNTSIDNLIEGSELSLKSCRNVRTPYKKVALGYHTRIKFNYKFYHLGVFLTEELALKAHEIARTILFENNHISVKELRRMVQEKLPPNSTTKSIHEGMVKGWCIVKGKYQVGISVNNKKRHVGVFNTPEEAHAAYLKAKEEYKNAEG